MSKEIPNYFPPSTVTTRAFAAPWNYIQGPGEFDKLAKYSQRYSNNIYVLIDSYLYDNLGERLKKSFADTDAALFVDRFNGECCQKEIDRVSREISARGARLAIAVGGGKTLDTVKAAAITMDIHVIIVPTAASNDAPVSSLAVIYTDEGAHDHSVSFNRGSDMVLVDSEIILGAPRRLLVAGMGDALSTYFEARACERSQVHSVKGCMPCKVGMAIARLSYEVLLADSVKALMAYEKGIVSEAFENIIEANVMMSGLGFQNTGCSIAHSINSGFSELPETARYLHGELVGFGVLVQLVFENAPMEEIGEVMHYMASVGLPLTLKQVGVEATKEKINVMTEKMVYRNALAHTQAKVVSQETLGAAILVADAMGESYLAHKLFAE